VQIAAEYLSTDKGGQGLMLGGISGVAPAEVVVIGAGTVGEFATRAALGSGASVKVFDKSIYRLRRLQSASGSASGPASSSRTCCAGPGAGRRGHRGAAPEHGRTPMVVSEDMVGEMKTGSVIVDVSIDRGGCFETSRAHQLGRSGVQEIRRGALLRAQHRQPGTAHGLLRPHQHLHAHAALHGRNGRLRGADQADLGLRHGVYLYNGALTSEVLSEAFRLPFKDLDIMLAAF
jgi:alanine dehydrogenase